MKIKYTCQSCEKEYSITDPSEPDGFYTAIQNYKLMKLCPNCHKQIVISLMNDSVKKLLKGEAPKRLKLYVFTKPPYKFEIGDITRKLLFEVEVWRRGRHNKAKRRYDFWFHDLDDQPWHGVMYGNNWLAWCRPLKHERFRKAKTEVIIK